MPSARFELDLRLATIVRGTETLATHSAHEGTMEIHTMAADPAVLLASMASAVLAAILLVTFGRPKVSTPTTDSALLSPSNTKAECHACTQSYANKNLPPGPKPDFLVGNRNQVPSVKPWRWFKKLNDQYGDMFLLWMGQTPVVVIGSGQVAWDLLGELIGTLCKHSVGLELTLFE